MPRPRTMLALGTFPPERRKRLENLAREAGFELVVRDTAESASKWIETGTPRVVLFDTAVAKAHAVCLKVRSKKLFSAVPIIGLVRSNADSALSKLFAAGADDFVSINSQQALRRRLQAVPADESLQPPPDRGVAVVADSDHDRCAVIGRTMMNAGYEVRFAVERRMLEHYASSSEVRLVVASAELGPAVEMVEASRVGGCEAPWIITDIERDVAAGAEIIPNARGAVVVSAFIPPDCLLFVSNDLISNTGASKRAHVRALHGTSVSFREAGSEEDDLGFTYNVSLEGLFIRTLAPPSDTRVWLELSPPGQSRRVRLVGDVKWKRPFNPGKFAITPPGFGVQIRDGLADDLELWSQSIEKLVGNARRRRSVNELLEETLRDSWIEPVPAQAVAPPSLPPLTDLGLAAAPKLQHAPRPGDSRAPAPGESPKPAAVRAPSPPHPKGLAKTLLGLSPPGKLPLSPPVSKPASEPKSPGSQPRPKLASEPRPFDAKASQPKQAATPPSPVIDQQPMITLEDLFGPEAPPPAPVAPPSPVAPPPPSAPINAPATPVEASPAPVAPSAARQSTPVEPAAVRSDTAAATVVTAPKPSSGSKKRLLVLVGALAVVVIGAATAVFALSSSKPSPASIPPAPVTAPAASATAAATPKIDTPQPAISASASSAPVSSASAAPSSAASAAASAPEVPDEGPDGSELLSMEGYLIVKSTASLDVYATGLKVGKTNERNKSRCGMKFVRLGEGDPPKWKSAGATVTVACRSVTRVSIEPK